jgi:hypothetical protein
MEACGTTTDHIWQQLANKRGRVSVEEIPIPLWNQKFRYCSHNSPTFDPTLNQVNPTPQPSSYNSSSNVILPSTPGSLKWSLPSIFSRNNIVGNSQLSHACYMRCVFIKQLFLGQLSARCGRAKHALSSLVTITNEHTCAYERAHTHTYIHTHTYTYIHT